MGVAYKVNGKKIDYFPSSMPELSNVEVSFIKFYHFYSFFKSRVINNHRSIKNKTERLVGYFIELF